jgi:peptidoglycan hydrolase CwlO-like protein
MKRLLIALCILSVSVAGLGQTAQDKAKMERERQAIQQELKEIQSVYNRVKGQTKQTLGQATLLQRKMNLQNRYVSNINKEIRLLTDDIYLSNLDQPLAAGAGYAEIAVPKERSLRL